MIAQLDVSRNILDQFASQLQLTTNNDQLEVDSAIGHGSARLWKLPNQLELYHFDIVLNAPFEIRSRNPEDSEWLLLNINLSDEALEKKVNDQKLSFQKFLPSGILLYTPQTEVASTSPPEVPFSIVLIRFHRSLLENYPDEKVGTLLQSNASVIYEDLDYQSERVLLRSILQENRLLLHSDVLEFLGLFFEKLKSREGKSSNALLHPDDLKRLFFASAMLRNPFNQEVPSVEELSRMAGMGTTKFNSSFKQVFGTTPLQYNLKIRMEYAKDQLLKKLVSPSEISHQLGYSHPSKFTTAFKKQFGVLPSQL